MATLRQWFNNAKVDWETLTIIHQPVADENHWPGSAAPFWAEQYIGDFIPSSLIDKEFNDGYGGPEAPRFIAWDKDRIYFPWQYDGSTGLTEVYRDFSKYLDPKNETPYPGG